MDTFKHGGYDMAIDNGYCTLAELKAVLRITDSVDDNLLERRIEEASRVIDDHCNRFFWKMAPVGQGNSNWKRHFITTDDSVVFVNDIAETTGLVIKIDVNGDNTHSKTLTASEYQLEPLNALEGKYPITRIRATTPGLFPLTQAPAPIEITARWGWPDIPYPVRSACILLAGRLVKRGDSLLGVAGFGDLGAITVRAIDPDVERMLRPFRVMVVA
jgi:hypothetical protein